MKKVAVIPCYNEGKTIGEIVTKCKKYVDDVIVVDDQSIDDTAAVAQEKGAIVVRTSGEHGPGKACSFGILSALQMGADVIVTLDGDGQHDPEEIPNLLKSCRDSDAVITSRFLDNSTKVPFYRKLGIWLITVAYNFNSKITITDSQCCFRAFHRKIFERISITEKGFGFSTELLIKLRQAGFSIREIPTHVFYFDDFSSNSSMNPIKHGFMVLMNTIKWRIRCELLGG